MHCSPRHECVRESSSIFNARERFVDVHVVAVRVACIKFVLCVYRMSVATLRSRQMLDVSQ